MYILITGLSLFWIGLEFESCGAFKFSISYQNSGEDKKSSELWKSDLFFQRKWQKPSAFLLISVFFSDSLLSLVFFSIIFLPLHCFLSFVQRQRSSFSWIFYCVYVWQFFSRGPLIFLFHFLSFLCGKVSFSSTPGCGLYGISCNGYVSQVIDS